MAVGAWAYSAPVHANEEESAPQGALIGNAWVVPGDPLVISTDEISRARAEENPEGEPSASEKRQMAKELVASAAEDGAYLDESSVDIVTLLDGDIVVALPVDGVLEEVTVEAGE